MSSIVTVASLVRYLKSKVDIDPKLQGLIVKGEISNFVAHRSGHFYFTLKDDNAKISCVMFANKAYRCPLKLENGMNVLVQGSVSIYESSGQCQIYVDTIELDGLGQIYQRIEALKKQLLEEGLFDASHKKTLPQYPMKIAVISAMEGAATQDVFTTIKRRWPVSLINFYPSLVQGENAAKDIIERLNQADNEENDVILLVRGGGSIEDLFCFYDEQLLRTIYELHTPIVTGVGHETDTTLVDYVSDMRAPTPTAAAELITPDYRDVLYQISTYENQLLRAIKLVNQNKSMALQFMKQRPYIQNPQLKISDKQHDLLIYKQRIDHFKDIYQKRVNVYYYLKERLLRQSRFIDEQRHSVRMLEQQLVSIIQNIESVRQNKLKMNISLLDAYSPLKILAKGYSITYSNNKLIKSIKEIHENEIIDIIYIDGSVNAKIIDKEN